MATCQNRDYSTCWVQMSFIGPVFHIMRSYKKNNLFILCEKCSSRFLSVALIRLTFKNLKPTKSSEPKCLNRHFSPMLRQYVVRTLHRLGFKMSRHLLKIYFHFSVTLLLDVTQHLKNLPSFNEKRSFV